MLNRHWVSALVLSLLSPFSAHASTIVAYAFDNGGPTYTFENPGVSSIDPGIATSAWSVQSGAVSSLRGQSGSDFAIASTHFQTGNQFLFSITVNSGAALSLDGFSFWEQGSGGAKGDGPSNWTFSINTQQVAKGTTVLGGSSGGRVESGPLSLTGLTGTVNLAIFANGASNDDQATWRVDNFTLTGTVSAVPLPPALALFGSALVPLILRRRRRA